MIHFKSCIRCNGDVQVNSDMYGKFMSCLQCGWSRDISPDLMTQLFSSTIAEDIELVAKRAS